MADQKWEGECTGDLNGVPADHVWALLADFCNVQKCMPNIRKCIKLEGEDGKPGLVRLIHHRVSSDEPQVLDADLLEKENGLVWAKERLQKIDSSNRYLSYDLIDNNIGVKTYEAAFKVEETESGSKIIWTYFSDPIEGMTINDMKAQRSFLMETMIEKIQSEYKKYNGLNIAEVKGVSPEKVWSLISDFCNLHKCYPHVYYCVKIEGEERKPGVVREIRSLGSPASKLFAADEVENYLWSRDKLVEIDNEGRSLRYEMMENNVGMKGYVCCYRVVESEGGNCRIEWSFESEPIDGKTVEQFRTHRDNILRTFVEKIQADFGVPTA